MNSQKQNEIINEIINKEWKYEFIEDDEALKNMNVLFALISLLTPFHIHYVEICSAEIVLRKYLTVLYVESLS